MTTDGPESAPDPAEPPDPRDPPVDWPALVGLPAHVGETGPPTAVIVVAERWGTSHRADLERRLRNVSDLGAAGLRLGASGAARVLVAGAYGAMQAVEPVHVAARLGVRRAVLLGRCAALQPPLAVGDVVLVQSATVGEGVSGFYGAAGTAHPDAGMSERAGAALHAAGLSVHRGRVVSGAVTLAQQPRLVGSWAASGHLALDLETSAVLAAANELGVAAAAMLIVDAAGDDVTRAPGLALAQPARQGSSDATAVAASATAAAALAVIA